MRQTIVVIIVVIIFLIHTFCVIVTFLFIPLATLCFLVGNIYLLVSMFGPAIGIALSFSFGTICLTFIVKILVPFYSWLAENKIFYIEWE